MGAVQRPTRGDPIALADLLVRYEAKVGEQLEVERDRAPRTLVASVLEGVDVVDKVRVVDVGNPAEVLPGADVLQRPPGDCCLFGLGGVANHGRALKVFLLADNTHNLSNVHYLNGVGGPHTKAAPGADP
jgi:hypothetical protein